jgi:chromosomal replication initiation ATPase DnaA
MQVIEFNIDRDTNVASIKWQLTDEEVSNFNVKDYLSLEPQMYERDAVIRATFKAMDYPIEMMDYTFSRDRSGKFAKVVEVRAACMYQLRKHTDMTLMAIGKLFGFTHATVIHNIRVFQDRLDIGDEHAKQIDREVEYILAEL